jgi:hypothetical protein
MWRRHRPDEALPEIPKVDLTSLSRHPARPALAVATSMLLARAVAPGGTVAFYEDAP